MRVAAQIEQRLVRQFAPKRLELLDESEMHHGHAGWREGGETHFRLLIVADAFAGQSRIQRQRAVLDVLADLMRDRVHALSMRTLTPDEDKGTPDEDKGEG